MFFEINWKVGCWCTYVICILRTVINESSLSPLLFFYYHICVGTGFLSQKYLCNIDYTLTTISTTLQQDTYLTYLTMPTRKSIHIYIHIQSTLTYTYICRNESLIQTPSSWKGKSIPIWKCHRLALRGSASCPVSNSPLHCGRF